MNDSDSARLLAAVRRARRLTDLLLAATAVLAAGCALWIVADPAGAGDALVALGMPGAPGMATVQGLGLGALFLLQTGLWGAAFLSLRRLFAAMAAAPPFPPAASASARAAWRWMLAAFVCSFLSQPIGSVVGSWHLPDGERFLSVGFGSAEMVTLVAISLTAIMARALALAAELWRDASEIV